MRSASASWALSCHIELQTITTKSKDCLVMDAWAVCSSILLPASVCLYFSLIVKEGLGGLTTMYSRRHIIRPPKFLVTGRSRSYLLRRLAHRLKVTAQYNVRAILISYPMRARPLFCHSVNAIRNHFAHEPLAQGEATNARRNITALTSIASAALLNASLECD